MSFMIFPPEINSGLMYSGAGSGPLMAAASAWDELAADLEASASALPGDRRATDRNNLVGSVFGANGFGDGAVCGLAGRHRGPSRPDRQLKPGWPPLPMKAPSRDGPAGGDRCQSVVVGGVGRHQLPGPEHPGDRGHRGALHGNVVPGRAVDGHLRHRFAAGRRVARADPGADDQRWRCCPPTRPRRPSRREFVHHHREQLGTNLQGLFTRKLDGEHSTNGLSSALC